MQPLKLFMLLLGAKPPGRHTEQHDVFFGIAYHLKDLIPEIQAFWPEPEKVHIDAWREVNFVEGYHIKVSEKQNSDDKSNQKKQRLFFINLGGYQENKFEEQHYTVLAVKEDKALAYQQAKETLFFQKNHFTGANSHIDDKYGIDVDDLYEIEDILSPAQKLKYTIQPVLERESSEDLFHLGYLKLSRLEKGILSTE